MTVRTYASRQMSVILGGVIISGYAPDSFLNITPASDSFEKSVGASGEVSRVEKADRTGNMTLTLQQTAPSNESLRPWSPEEVRRPESWFRWPCCRILGRRPRENRRWPYW